MKVLGLIRPPEHKDLVISQPPLLWAAARLGLFFCYFFSFLFLMISNLHKTIKGYLTRFTLLLTIRPFNTPLFLFPTLPCDSIVLLFVPMTHS